MPDQDIPSCPEVHLQRHLNRVMLERDEALAKVQRLTHFLDRVGLYFAGTEHQHVSEKIIRWFQEIAITPPMVDQALVARIVKRAQDSSLGLAESDKPEPYNLGAYTHHNLESLALLLVSAHDAKYDIVSIVTAAFIELNI